MSDYELTGTKWGAATAGSGGGVVTWSLARMAGKLLSFDTYIGEDAFANLIRKAFNVWESVINIDFREVADSFSSDIRLGMGAIDGTYGTIGHAKWSYSNRRGEFDENRAAEIKFDTAERWNVDSHLSRTEVDFYATALHEIGHTIGLEHSGSTDTIMYYSQQRDALALSDHDIEGARAIYGPAITGALSGSGGSVSETRIVGTNGDDTLRLGSNVGEIDGRGGRDTVFVAGSRDGFEAKITGSRVALENLATDDIDYLDNVERIRFDDGTLATDVDGNVSEAYRLYQAAFDRKPDAPGLTHWTRLLDEGHLTLEESAGLFTQAEEFHLTYGPPADQSDDDFVVMLYQNVLHRAPEDAGRAHWNAQFDHGMSRGRMLAEFSESLENHINVQADIQDGIWLV